MSWPSVLRIAVPNPFFEGRNSVYLIASDPLTLIDTGVATDKAYQALRAGLAEYGFSVSDVKRVVLTHKHIDHIGNAWRIQRQSGAEILIHEGEVGSVTDVDPGGKRFTRLVAERMRDWRVPDGVGPGGRASKMPHWQLQSAEAGGLVDGQALELAGGCLEVMHVPGHTMGSICLKYGEHLFSGDHVLEHISPNVGAGDMRRRGMLAHFLASLARIRDLDADFEVMPGHGEPFPNLRERCEELIQHHEQRLGDARRILGEGSKTVYEVARGLFGTMDDFHVVLGCAEASSHLELLIERGEVELLEEDRYRAV